MTAGPYYQTFNPDQNYVLHKFTGDERGIQTRELNELQLRENTKVQKFSNKITTSFVDSGGFTSIDGAGLVTLAASYVFVNGDYLRVAGGTVTIPAAKAVKVGVRATEATITSTEDAGLLNPAVDTAGFDKPGADRLRKNLAWGWVADDATNDGGSGTFYPLMYFYDRLFLAQKKDFRMPKVVIDNAAFDGMTLFAGLIYDIQTGETENFELNVDNDSFYLDGFDTFGFMNSTVDIAFDYQVHILRADAAIRFNTKDIDLQWDKPASFYIKREASAVWTVSAFNYS
jgi:hypothetical protein